MEQLALTTADNLFDFALAQYEDVVAEVEDFDELEAEDHFDLMCQSLENFLEAAENSEYLEDMEDPLAAVVAFALALSVKAGLFTEPVV